MNFKVKFKEILAPVKYIGVKFMCKVILEHLRKVTYIFAHFKAKPGDYNILLNFKLRNAHLKYILLLASFK